jgi:uncharacterized protein YjiK
MSKFPPARPKSWRWPFAAIALALLAWAAFVALRFHHLGDRVSRWWRDDAPGADWNQPRWRGRSLWLPGYRFDIENREIDAVDGNLSGLDFDRDRGELLAVVNRPAELLVLDTEGRLRRRHRLDGASDVEAVAYLGGRRVALLQEGRRSIAIATLPERDGAAIRVDGASAYVLRGGARHDGERNDGPEGMAYDPATDTLYVVNERAPPALYAVRGLQHGNGAIERVDHSDWMRRLPFATDLSSLEFDRAHRHLLLLSDEAQLLAEIDLDGEPVSWLSLRDANRDGWPAPQPEGVTLDDAGLLYIVSEPNLFYRMRRGAP